MCDERLVRSLVMLGALLGVFALHGLSFSSEEPAAAPVAQSARSVLQVDPHGVIERLEQVAMLAPDTFAVEAPDHLHALIPCVAFAAVPCCCCCASACSCAANDSARHRRTRS